MILNLDAYVNHGRAWQRNVLRRGRMTWWERLRVRRALARRYRECAVVAPRHAFVDSPVAATIASGIAAGIRWLQRHPEAQVPLFGRTLERADLLGAAKEAIAQVTAKLELAPDCARIMAAIALVTAHPAAPLPTFARARSRPFETIDSAPALAASDGAMGGCVLFDSLERIRDQIMSRLSREDVHLGDVELGGLGEVFDHMFAETLLQDPAPSFLGRTLAAWWRMQHPLRDQTGLLAFVSYFRCRRAFGIDYRGAADIERAMRPTSALYVHADFWIAADWPTWARDDRGRPHRVGAPAVRWRDGAGLTLLHGVRVSRAICEGRFGIGEILHASNAEIRRTMIELYERGDRGRFMRDVNADVIHIDYDKLGYQQRLLRMVLPGDEAYVAVEVVNSSPEPDGSHKKYILRVPPSITTCRAAIAWTFGLAEHEYEPAAET